MIMLGIMLMERVITRRIQGLMVHRSIPSLTICPAMVQTIPAEMPDKSRAKAKIVPAAEEIDEERRVWMPNRSASVPPGTS